MKKILFIFTVSIILNSCGTTMDISYDYDKNVDFSEFSTFTISKWNEDNSEMINDFTKDRFLNAMRNEMIKRGMTEVDENADIKLDISIVTDLKKYTTAYTTRMGYGGWYGWYGPGMGGISSTEFVEHKKLIGSIILDVYNEKTKKLAWQGVGVGEINKNKRLTENDVNKLIFKLYYKYPVKIKK